MTQVITLGTEFQKSILLALYNIKKLLTPSVKITLIIRHQSDDKCFSIFGDDDLNKARETLDKHLKTKQELVGFNGMKPASND